METDNLHEHLDVPDSDIEVIVGVGELELRVGKPTDTTHIIVKLAKEVLFLRRELRRSGKVVGPVGPARKSNDKSMLKRLLGQW